MNFDAHTALAAVEGSGRAQVLTGVAVAHFVVTLAGLDVTVLEGCSGSNPLLVLRGRQILELVE